MFFASALVLTGCAPGSITWEGGFDDLRTGLHVPLDDGGIVVLATTAHLECAWIDELARHTPELALGACREDARHVFLRLRPDDGTAAGTYPIAFASPYAEPPPGAGATARLIAIEEASLEASNGLRPEYRVEEVVQAYAGEGEVVVRGEDDLRIAFELSDLGVHGRVRTEPCPEGADLVALFEAASASACDYY